ncbi:AlbA family DNA-binding domain-containing protein [Candidatus Avoscillospira sp. LCP25S3_F1]|uniref:AlbA family DNA-binding domain-containing protein n=1 Tax=Candidatus Avoscillospira sp. LCP25S3_F1 TaxID=3438825 RepID=UPI003F93D824
MTKDDLLVFFKEPTLEAFSDFLEKNVGEGSQVEFKGKWISDVKLAKIMIGMANSGGGCIVIGVSENDNGTIVASGISAEDKIYDPADFSKIVEKYLPQKIGKYIEIKNFFYENDVYGSLKGKKFQVIFISVEIGDLPIICESDGQRENEKIKRGEIYIRRGSKTDLINYDELQEVLTRSFEARRRVRQDITLEDELDQLKVLYDAIPVSIYKNSFSAFKQNHSPIARELWGHFENKVFPKQSFEEFLKEMIEDKEEKIRKALF